MALIALERLGADEAAMTRFTELYAPKLVPKEAAKTRLTRETWKLHLGKHTYHTDHVELIDGHWSSIGKDELLRRYVPLLLGGVGAAAFHGLIRVAYGLDADNRTEIVEGLAHWSDTYLAIARDRRRPELSPATAAESLARVASDRDLAPPRGGNGGPIYQAMATVSSHHQIHEGERGRTAASIGIQAGPFCVPGDAVRCVGRRFRRNLDSLFSSQNSRIALLRFSVL